MEETIEHQGRMEAEGGNRYFWIDLNERNLAMMETVKILKDKFQSYRVENERLIKM